MSEGEMVEEGLAIRRWKDMVRVFKQGPNFGVHGTETKNLQSITEAITRDMTIPGHYYAVDEEAKKLPDELFYERLFASVNDAVGFSIREFER